MPALRALPEFELRAVGTSSAASARAAEAAFGVRGYDNSQELITQPDVDLVVVAVKVPHHHALISAALDAGKMVFSEWPLGRNLAEAEDLAAHAARAGVRTAIGLQARFAPAVHYTRELVRQGYVGKVLGTTLVGSGIAWAGTSDHAHAYLFDADNGATTLSVPTMHALDALTFVLGEFASISATSAIRRPSVRLEDGSDVLVSAHDHIAIAGQLQNGAIASVFYRGGVSRGENLHWEINGSDGDLVITSAIGNLQVADLKLEGGRGADARVASLPFPPEYANAPGGLSGEMHANVLRTYAQLAQDIREDTHTVPDFAYAVQRHRLMAAIEDASRSGVAQRIR